MWKGKGTRISFQNSLKKNNKMGGISLQDFKNYYTTSVTKIVWFGRRERHKHQWNQSEKSKIVQNKYN